MNLFTDLPIFAPNKRKRVFLYPNAMRGEFLKKNLPNVQRMRFI